MNINLRSRLYNWKFKTALKYIKDESDENKEIIKSLANLFADCGWFDGELGILISVTVEKLMKEIK